MHKNLQGCISQEFRGDNETKEKVSQSKTIVAKKINEFENKINVTIPKQEYLSLLKETDDYIAFFLKKWDQIIELQKDEQRNNGLAGQDTNLQKKLIF